MPWLREMMAHYLADGKVDRQEIDALGDALYLDRTIDRAEADFLIDLRKRVERFNPAFEQFFYLAIKRHILADGGINDEEVAWLRHGIFASLPLRERDKKLLRELRGEASYVGTEFETMYEELLE